MKIPISDLKAQYKLLKNEIDKAIKRVLEDQAFISFPAYGAILLFILLFIIYQKNLLYWLDRYIYTLNESNNTSLNRAGFLLC